MSTADPRCPRCAALVRADAQWCGLCLFDLRPPAPQPTPPQISEPEPVLDVLGLPVGPLPGSAASVEAATLVETATLVEGSAGASVSTSTTLLDVTTAPQRTGGKHARPAATVDRSAGLPTGVGDELGADDPEVVFALLRAQGRDPLLAKVEGSLSSPGARLTLIVGGALGLALVLFVGAGVLGLVLG